MSPTVPLVMVLFGIVYGRCPSPVPRCDSAKMCTSSAFWLPSGCGIAALPTNEPGLISASDALTTPTIAALAVSVRVCAVPSVAFTTTVLPSTFSIVPRMRMVCCADAPERPSAASTAAAATIRIVSPLICLLLRVSSHRRRGIAPDIDARGRQRAVRLLGRRADEHFCARLEVSLVARRVGHDRAFRSDHDLLLAVLVLEMDLVLADRCHLLDRRIGHGALGLEIPRPVALAGAAHGLGEDVDLPALLAAVRLRHTGDADEGALLDVGIGRLHHGGDRRLVLQRRLHVTAFARL